MNKRRPPRKGIRTFIPFMQGRPIRDTIIQKDEIINLVIELNKPQTVDKFLEKI